jgi:hypothetical protein
VELDDFQLLHDLMAFLSQRRLGPAQQSVVNAEANDGLEPKDDILCGN